MSGAGLPVLALPIGGRADFVERITAGGQHGRMSSGSTKRRSISSGSDFERQIGYTRAVVVGDHVYVSGTTGFDYATMTISDDVVEQVQQCLRNIETALAQSGCTTADVVRVRYLLPDRDDFEPCWPYLRAVFGAVPPAATMQVCGLSDPRMRIEIEVDARLPG